MSHYDMYLDFIAAQGWGRDDVSCDLENSIRSSIQHGEPISTPDTFRGSDGRIYGRWN